MLHTFFRAGRILLALACCALSALPAARGQASLDQSPYRQRADSLLNARKRPEALAYLRGEKNKLDAAGQQRSLDYTALLLAQGHAYLRSDSAAQAGRSYRAALDLHRDIAPADQANRIILLNALADFLERYSPPDALPLYEEALQLRLAVAGENSRSAATGYYELAVIHLVLHAYDKASDYCQKAIRSLRNAGLTAERDYAGYHQVLGLIHHEEGNLLLALQYYRQALDTFRVKFGEHIETARCMGTLGEAYAQAGEIDKALEYQQASLAMFERVDTLSGRYRRASLYYLGVTYNLARQPEKALDCFQRVLYFGAKPGEKRSMPAQMAYHCSNAYRMLGDYDKALASADTALAILNAPRDRIYRWRVLLAKAQALTEKIQRNNDPAAAPEVITLLKEAQTTLSAIIADFHNERDKMAIYREALKGFDLTATIQLQLYALTGDAHRLDAALEVAETSKGLLSYHRILESRYRRRSAVPRTLATEDMTLGARIGAAEQRLFELGDNAPAGEKDSLQEIVFTLKNRREVVREQIRAVCNDYFADADAFPAITAGAIRAGLPTGTGLLEFFAGDSTYTAFLVLPDTLIYRKIGSKKTVDAEVARFRESIGRYFLSPDKTPALYLASASDYAASAHALYRLLLAPFGDVLPKSLTVAPDGALAYLPFEALLVEMPARPDRFHLHHYLMKDLTLRYAPSAALLREMENRPPAPDTLAPLLALAPFFTESGAWRDSLLAFRSNRAPLPFSGEEVMKIAGIAGGEALEGTKATKEVFIRKAPRYRVLHLATHAWANDVTGDLSYLDFAPDFSRPNAERLYVNDIYGLPLDAELVTLSACETGLGQLERGEGIVGLSRAFAAAGARAVVQSQWAVGDASTRRLMEMFYQNLAKRLPKDLALQKARQEYLLRFRGEEAHPYFWAGFVLFGDNRPVSF